MQDSYRGDETTALAGQQADATDTGQKSAARDQQGGKPKQAVAPSLEQVPTQSKAAVTNQQAQTEQPRPHDLRDLAAQEDMAFWAMWMFVAALGTLVVTSFGTFLIWRQVKLTRKAVEDTGEATEAMRHQNEIARDTANRQLRAYVTVEDHTLTGFFRNGPAVMTAKVWNRGQTPAYDVRVISIVAGTQNADPSTLKIRFTKKEGFLDSTGTLGPGQWVEHFNGCQGPLRNDAYVSVVSGGVSLVFAGVVTYRDAFRRRHWTTFKYFYRGTGDHASTMHDLFACNKGNIAS